MKRIIFLLLTLALLSCNNENKSNKEEKKEEKIEEKDVDKVMEKQESNSSKVGIRVGETAPEINLPDVNGKSISLYSLRGQYVLIDFWASWCGPCRFENPNLINLYKKYKDKGLEIYGVSLDEDKEKWERAIQKDGITWLQVSDLQHWNSSVVPLYKLEGIPASFLLDKKGIIVASYLRGEHLEEKVKELIGE